MPLPPGVQDIPFWTTKYESSRTANMNTARGLAKSMDSQWHYDCAYYIDGATAMWRATGDTQYLDDALELAWYIRENAQISENLGAASFEDGYLGWRSERVDVAGEEVPLFESYCWRYITNLLRVMRETPSVYNAPSYRVQYDDLLRFAKEHIWEKWNTRGANSYVYRVNTHMCSHWAWISANLALCTEDPDERAMYFAVMNNIEHNLPNASSSLRGQMQNVGGTRYFWNENWGSTSTPGQDVAHGNAVMAYVCEMNKLGLNWTSEDMTLFVGSFNHIWPSGTTYRAFMDGTGTGTGWFNDGFCKLGRYNSALQIRLETHTVGQNIQLFGNGALNVYYLSL